MTAPDRIWILRDHRGRVIDVFENDIVGLREFRDDVEYARADLCIRRDDPALLAVVEALRQIIDNMEMMETGTVGRIGHTKRLSTSALAAITERMGLK